MRTVWRMSRAGSLTRLARATETLPDPGPGEARLCVEAIGLNFADVLACPGAAVALTIDIDAHGFARCITGKVNEILGGSF